MSEAFKFLIRHGYWLAVGVYAAVFSRLSFVRHDDLRSFFLDLGNFDHWVWSVLHGNREVVTSRLAFHFDPILFAFVPVYAVVSSPKVLLAAQSLALGLAAVPIHLLAREKFRSPAIPWIFSLSYLLHPAVHYANLYDFHPVTLAVPILAFMFYCLETSRLKTFLALAAAALLCKEEMGLVLVMFGIYAWFVEREKGIGISVAGIGAASFLVIMGWIIPHFSPTGSHLLINRYRWLGETPAGVAGSVLRHPLHALEGISGWDRVIHLLHLFGPLAFVPLMGAPVLLMAVPDFLINLLSANPMTYSIFFYHWSTVIPFLYMAAVSGLSAAEDHRRVRRAVSLYIVLATGLLFAYLSPAFPYSENVWETSWTVSEGSKHLGDVERIIPPDAALSVQNDLGAHFSERRSIRVFPDGVGSADTIVVRIYNPYRHADRLETLEYALGLSIGNYAGALRDALNDDYGILYAENGFYVLRKGLKGDSVPDGRARMEKDLAELRRSAG